MFGKKNEELTPEQLSFVEEASVEELMGSRLMPLYVRAGWHGLIALQAVKLYTAEALDVAGEALYGITHWRQLRRARKHTVAWLQDAAKQMGVPETEAGLYAERLMGNLLKQLGVAEKQLSEQERETDTQAHEIAALAEEIRTTQTELEGLQ